MPVAGDQIDGTRYVGREGDLFQTAGYLDSSHPSIQQDNRWGDVKFYRAIRVEPGSARVVARLSDETPLLIDQAEGQGHILIFASTFDNIDNDFPVHASFVPFVSQTARYLGRLESGPASVTVGAFEELRDSTGKGHGRGRARSQGRACVFARRGRQGAEHPVHRRPAFTISAGPTDATSWWL